MKFPKPIEDLIDAFMNYPGVGRKTAERYAFHTINKLDQDKITQFTKSMHDVKHLIKACSVCHQLTDQEDKCEICKDDKRDSSVIMVVEKPKDVFAFEESANYHGLYHVLNGVISPLDGIGPDDINLKSLWNRVYKESVKEVIIATSSTQQGETTALYIGRVLEKVNIHVTRIGAGLPVGINLEYADHLTLEKAIENRKKL